jgi:long-chain acyl-CoA synthetase
VLLCVPLFDTWPMMTWQGEYVAVEFLESEFGKSQLVEQIWLYGSSFESCLVAVVVPIKAKLMEWAKQQPSLAGDCAAVWL